MFRLSSDLAKLMGEMTGILKAIGGTVPCGMDENTFKYQFFTILRAIRERLEETEGFVARVTSYPDGSKAEFITETGGPGIKFTLPGGDYTILRIGENGVTVNDIPVVLDE